MNNYFDDYLNRLKEFSSNEDVIKSHENEIDKDIKSGNFQQYSKEEWLQIKDAISINMKKVSNDTEKVIEIRNDFKNELKDKICFIGWTGTGTTDIGSTPFEKKFVNVGTHPSVFNTIIQKDFIYMVPFWVVLIISIIFFGIIVWFLTRKKSTIIAGFGFSSIILIIIFDALFYRFTNFYITPVIPFLYGFFCIITMIILEFIITESDKSFLRNTFGRYLSPAVIHELLKDPDKVELGGERRNCTAIFTDIEGFSSFSELFMDDPKGLVSLLNGYLSTMSDIILDNGGTIDKYEGDAIIGFFGAPHDMEDHPLRACISSIKMKQAELSLNKVLLDQKLIEKPLHTRIGINTGFMFVGNMGTEKRLDYTMMGHAVNLAARLEGVNKQYGTYQLISEFTYEKVSDKITTRKLDRVRVVNINTPIRLYELIAIKDETPKEILEYLEIFHNGLEEFENKKWKEALKFFKMVKDLKEIDITTDIYIDRCKKFIKNPPVDESWDGVYNLTIK
jgi:adenylate cyclase